VFKSNLSALQCASIFGSLLLLATRTHAAPKTLKETLQFGLSHSPRIVASSERVRASGLLLENHTKANWPSLDFVAGHGVSTSVPRDSTSPYQSKFSLRASQKLYDNGEAAINEDVGGIDLQIAKLAENQVRDQLILEMTSAFYRLSSGRLSEEVQRSRLKSLEEQRLAIKHQITSGFRSPRELLRIDAQVQRAQTSLSDSEAAMAKTVIELVKLTGMDKGSTKQDFEQIPLEEGPALIAKTAIVADSTEARLMLLEQKKNVRRIDLLHKENAPQFYLTGEVGYGADGYLGSGRTVSETDRLGASAMLEIKYNLWDGGRRSREIAAALANNLASQADNEDRTATLKATTANLVSDQAQKIASYRAAIQLLKLEEESYSYLETGYKQGKVTYLEMVTALESYTDSRLSRDRLYFDLLVIMAEIRYHEGIIYETFAR
jgi:outer membrane protein TolC